jgi:bifunctional ADP-heptose synthase (sugar kinase/adenylyltransferase)/phosphoglycolate phosphatase-like HAD superfamily hydrolase
MDISNLLPYKNPPSVAVIGDICLDLYYFAGKEDAEVSVETGLQSYSVFESRQDLGGAGNTAADCAGLGAGRVDLYGLIGDDCWGKIILDLLGRRGIRAQGVLVQEKNWQTHVYHKIYSSRDELPRYDMGNRNCPENGTVDRLLELLESRLDEYQCVIINEQVPSGLHSPYFQEKLAALAAANRNRVIWFADCRKLNDRYSHTIRKLNNREAAEILLASGQPREKAEDWRFAASWLYRRWGLPVVITLGDEGALVQDETGCGELGSLHFTGEIDIVGAGDAFLAGLVTGYGAGLSLREAALIGTFSAGVSLGKLFETGHPTAGEVIALAEEGDFNYHIRLARDESLAVYEKGTDIEIVGPCPARRKGFPGTAIFDHDGTISVLRQGWEEVMRKVMVEAIAGPGPWGKDIGEIKAAVSSLIEKTTGIQTLAQMYRLRELVLSFGHVKSENVQTPEEYKALYNKALLAAMEKRVRGVEEGRLSPEDVTIKGAAAFLEKLAAAGTMLYLASGTDEEDVIREARLLGYAHLFTGGIRGSVGDIRNDPKKLVIRGIIGEIKAAGGDRGGVVVFGDGPVEMREAKKENLLAVGVLSDERCRYGLNRDKRERLVLAGADILIPDFSWGGELIRILGWE